MLIAHISDLHVARSPELGEYNAKRFLGYVNYRLFRGRRHRESVAEESLAKLVVHPPDLVVLTGDMTQHGLDTEFDAVEELLSEVTRHNIPIIAVAGNHDVYGCTRRETLDRLVRNLALGIYADEDGIIRFHGVELLPLSQGIPTLPFFAHGRQSWDELAKAEASWSNPPGGVMRLVCGHYPVIDSHGGRLLYFRGLREAASLLEFCARCRVAAYFCGHDHKRFAAPMPGGCIQYVAPSLSAVHCKTREWARVYECLPELAHPREIPSGENRGSAS